MELRHVRYFVTLAKELHFGRAAERLQLAQPALSQQIKQLETEIGVPLFHRTKRQVHLTEAGKVFLNRANQILIQVDDACEEAKRVHKGQSGELKLGFAGLVTFDLLPFILKVYREHYPNVKIVLRHLPTVEQVNGLLEEEIDVGILIPPIESVSLDLEVLRKESFIVALPKSHPLAQSASSLYMSDLMNESFIMPPRLSGPGYFDAIISLCYQAGFSPKTVQEAQELQTMVSLVASEFGVCILPASIQYLKNENVAYLPIQDEYTKIHTAIACKKDNFSPVVCSFLTLMKEEVIPHLLES